jgi:alkanesulfonate monooxygenase SsuD/methylene tetrahydromethanopterin reductase-like flavin-dependent oxidoreductase (luciferase family)
MRAFVRIAHKEVKMLRFGMSSEGDAIAGSTHSARYFELIDEVLLAEKVGFDMFGTSEQHFAIGEATVSAPEVLYPYLMALTSRITFMHKSSVMLTRVNHPLRIAERIATEDILSHGRIELCAARGNTTLMMRAFEVAPDETRSQLEEGIDLVRAAFLHAPFSFIGKHYKVPPRTLVPHPVQKPHPPLHVTATGEDSCRMAGRKGIGVLTFSNFLGFDALAKSFRIYDEAFDAAEHGFPTTRRRGGLVFAYHCAETTEQARKEIKPLVETSIMATGAYQKLAELSKDYAYMGTLRNNSAGFDDFDYLLEHSAGFIAGDPDECARQLAKYVDAGAEDIWLRIDTLPHEKLMKSIELTGKYVLPRVKSPEQIVQHHDTVLAAIRARRPKHEAALAAFLSQSETATESG